MNNNNTRPKSFGREKRGVGGVILAGILPLNGNNNLNTAITIPTTMEDGSTAIVPGYYTIMLSTGYNGPEADGSYNQGVYYFTFQVT